MFDRGIRLFHWFDRYMGKAGKAGRSVMIVPLLDALSLKKESPCVKEPTVTRGDPKGECVRDSFHPHGKRSGGITP